MIGFVVEE